VYTLKRTPEAAAQLGALEKNDPKKARKVKRALGYLEMNPRHPSLATHEYEALSRLLGVKVWEAYVENETPGAYRIFWYYGPDHHEITIYAITPHH